MEANISMVAGLVSGVIGYILTTFGMEPVIRYRDVRHAIVRDLVLYANAIVPMSAPNKPDPRVQKRQKANRERSAELHAVIVRLPRLYRKYLVWVSEDPEIAASQLIGLSNTSDSGDADRRITKIREALRVPRIV